MAKVGFWLIGAQGSLASTVVLGARAVARRLATGDKFRREQRLDTVIVVNVAATEPSRELTRDHQRLDRFRRAIQNNRRALVTPSVVYAYAALDRGFLYVKLHALGRDRGARAPGARAEAPRALLRARRQDG